MDLTLDADREALRAHLEGLYAGRPVLVGPGVLAGFLNTVGMLQQAGAGPILVLSTARGAGEVPDVEVVDVTPPETTSVTAESCAPSTRWCATCPPTWSPGSRRSTRTAAASGRRPRSSPPTSRSSAAPLPADARRRSPPSRTRSGPRSCGRPWASRGRPSHRRTRRRAPRSTRPATRSAARSSGRVTPARASTAAATTSAGCTTTEERAAALPFFAAHCDRVRVLPFLDGVPCSIHGIVLPEGTAVFRPVEIAILRGPRPDLHLRRPVDVLGPARRGPRGDARRRPPGRRAPAHHPRLRRHVRDRRGADRRRLPPHRAQPPHVGRCRRGGRVGRPAAVPAAPGQPRRRP